jgi:hypothetical protein
MKRGRVGEERGGKETDRCILTVARSLGMEFQMQLFDEGDPRA